MITETILECKDLIAGKGEVIFDTPVKVKITPHTDLFTIFGATEQKDELYVMDGAGKWHEVEEKQINVEYIVNSLLQRLKWMEYENV